MDPVSATTHSADQLAQRRVRAYLRCLGIGRIGDLDQATEALLSRWNGTSVEGLADQMDRWLARLAAECFPGEQIPPLLGWHLRRMLAEGPGAFLDDEGFDELRVRMSELCARAVPPERPAEMPTQPLGELPVLFRRAFWRQAAADLRASLSRSAKT